MPFDFDPLTMNFPALTLQCLRAQPTLFASTQLPTSASWSTSPPGASQFEALKSYFKEEFRKWRVKCAVATTAQYDEIKYPPSPQFQPIDRREAVERAEQSANALEQEASKHLEVAFHAWEELSDERKNELWVLELARGIATKQTEIDKLREAQSHLRQEASSLKNQIEQLNRLQQPREFRLVPPAHIPMNEKILFELQDAAISQGVRGIGLNINDRHSDLSTMVATAIGRWKNVIRSSRDSSTGLAAQRPLSTAAAPNAPSASGSPAALGSATSSMSRNNSYSTQATILPPPDTSATRSQRQPQRNSRHVAQPPPARGPTALLQRAAEPMQQLRTVRASAVSVSDTKAGANEDEDEEDEDGDEQEDEMNRDDTGPANPRSQAVAAGAIANGQSTEAEAITEEEEEEEDDDDDEEEEEEEEVQEDDCEEEEASDKDADAEMEDGDAFAHMHTPISRAIALTGEQPDKKSAAQPKVAKARNTAKQTPRTTGASGIGLINASRSMPNMNMAIHESTTSLNGDAMYMD